MMLIVMLLFSWLIGSAVFWLLCKIIKPLGRIIPREHRPSYALLLGIALYFFLFGAEWNNAENAFVQLALRQFATLFWLLAIIIVALMIRMKPERLKYGIRMYVPTFFMALTVITCRVTFLPNAILNYFFPPILILLSIWQLVSCLRNSGKAQGFDRFYCWISFGVTLAATITAICGYVFLALMVLGWRSLCDSRGADGWNLPLRRRKKGPRRPDFGEDSPNLSFDAQAAKKRQQGPVLGG